MHSLRMAFAALPRGINAALVSMGLGQASWALRQVNKTIPRAKTRRLRSAYFTLSMLVPLAGCGTMNIHQFAAGTPSMDPADWMVGTVDGYGLVTDRFGNVKSQFHAHETGVWNSSTKSLTLTEEITYLQGDKTSPTMRVWHFTEISPGHWTGTASDIIGVAIGTQEGNAWHLIFHQNLPIGGHQIEVTVDDWRIREADQVALDQSSISKLGVHLATANIAFVKSD